MTRHQLGRRRTLLAVLVHAFFLYRPEVISWLSAVVLLALLSTAKLRLRRSATCAALLADEAIGLFYAASVVVLVLFHVLHAFYLPAAGGVWAWAAVAGACLLLCSVLSLVAARGVRWRIPPPRSLPTRGLRRHRVSRGALFVFLLPVALAGTMVDDVFGDEWYVPVAVLMFLAGTLSVVSGTLFGTAHYLREHGDEVAPCMLAWTDRHVRSVDVRATLRRMGRLFPLQQR